MNRLVLVLLLAVAFLTSGAGHVAEKGDAVTLDPHVNHRVEPGMRLFMNEDCWHFWTADSGEDYWKMKPGIDSTRSGLERYIDEIARGQVTHFVMNINGQRANFPSKSLEPIWVSLDEPERTHAKWVKTLKRLFDEGVDPYAVWIARCRAKDVSPWISIRMNDLHYTGDPKCPDISKLWRAHPELQLNPANAWDNGFDYSKPQIRERMLGFIREVLARYDTDGIELDFLRFTRYLPIGRERELVSVMTDFMAEVRKAARDASARLGHTVAIGVRVGAYPKMSVEKGLDVGIWAKRGLVDFVFPCNMWANIRFDISANEWRAFIGDKATVVPGADSGITENGKRRQATREEYRRWATEMRKRGATDLYLFNLFLNPQDGDVWNGILSEGLCPNVATGSKGVLYLTFDDRHFSSWENALPVFAKYGAHATFFVYGSIDASAIATMRRLADAGHSLGLHGQGHAYACKTSKKLGMEKYLAQEVMPQLEAVRRAGLKVGSWAYPCSDRDAATDAALLRHFRRLRSGGYWDQTQNGKLAETDELFHSARGIPPVVTGASAGLAKPTVTGEVCRVLRRLAERGESAVLYAHNIRTDGVHDDHDLKIDELETILAEARRLGVAVCGFDEMPSAETSSEAIVRRGMGASAEIATAQAKQTDRVSVTDYARLVRRTNDVEVWSDAIAAALAAHAVVVLPNGREYAIDRPIVMPSNRRLEATGATVRMLSPAEVAVRTACAADGTLAPAVKPRGANIAVVGGRWIDWSATRRVGRHPPPPFGERGDVRTIEFGTNADGVHFRNVKVRLHPEKWPLSHFMTVGPKSATFRSGAKTVEVFDPGSAAACVT